MNVSRMMLVRIANSSKGCLKLQNAATAFASCSRENNYFHGVQMRSISTVETKNVKENEPGLVERVLNKLPFMNLKKNKLMVTGYLLYEGIADKINYFDFFEELDLPGTFYSWFVITELHIWLISVRAMAEGDEGKVIRNSLVEALWVDVAQRVKKLGAHNPAATRAQVYELSEQLQAALIAYDEGLQSDDAILAGAIWRRFYQQQDVNPVYLEMLVKYVRKQIRLLDSIPTEKLLTRKMINWEPLMK